MNYKIICNKTQLGVISAALHTLARSHMGQFAIALEDAIDNTQIKGDAKHQMNEELRAIGRRFSELAGHNSHTKMHSHAWVAWDMHQATRQVLCYTDHPEGGSGRSFDDPFIQSQEPRIEVAPTDEMADHRPSRVRFAQEIEEALGTTDLLEAVARVRMWKSAYDRLTEQPEKE